MHTLHAVYRGSNNNKGTVADVKAVQAARRVLEDSLGSSTIRSFEAAKEARVDGYVLVGEHSNPSVVREAAAIMEATASTMRAFVDASEEVLQNAAGVSAPEAGPILPTPKGYELALILLGATDGNVNRTMEAILGMKLNTNQRQWDEALVSLAAAHPWVKILAQQTDHWPNEG